MKSYFFFLLLLFSQLSSFAQYDKTKVNKKALSLFDDAKVQMGLMQTANAKKLLLKAVVLDPSFCDALILLGDIYKEDKEPNKAIELYKHAISIDQKYAGRKYRTIATLEIKQAHTEAAIANIKLFLEQPKITIQEKTLAQHELQQYNFMQIALKNPVPFVFKSMGDSINSSSRDYSPSITADGETLLFNRQLGEGANGNEDFYISKKINGVWSTAKNMGAPINTDNNEGAQCLSVDGNYIFYTICNNKKFQSSGCDIYISKRNGDNWSEPIPLDKTINTGEWESQPSFSADGNSLYFSAHRTHEGFGGTDLYLTTIDEQGKWTKPQNLGAAINTPWNEQSPFIHPDGTTLYFSSNGLPGMGGMDLFMVKKDKTGKWGTPVNLGYPINTAEDETNLAVTADGKTAFYASAMGKGGNNLDLYTFQLNPEAQATPVLYMKGTVKDKLTGKPIAAVIQLIDLLTGKIIIETQSDAINGSYLLCIPPEKNYALNVSHPDYLFYSENFSLLDHPSNEPYNKEVVLSKIAIGKSVVLNNIFFETNQFSLKQESTTELEKLIQFLRENPTLHIELGGHTDNSGSKEQNQSLSTNRAKAVYDYLVAHAIAANRLSFKGYADSQPITNNNTAEGKAQNRRTEFKITAK